MYNKENKNNRREVKEEKREIIFQNTKKRK